MVKGYSRREMTVDIDQKQQEEFEAAANIIFQLKQRYQINKNHEKMAIPAVEEVLHASSYTQL